MRTPDEIKRDRLIRNKEIADQVKQGTYVGTAFNKSMSWFPKRPIHEKDPNALEFLFSVKEVFCEDKEIVPQT
jgi:hypothetical protein